MRDFVKTLRLDDRAVNVGPIVGDVNSAARRTAARRVLDFDRHGLQTG